MATDSVTPPQYGGPVDPSDKKAPYLDIGRTGLIQYGGRVYEEFLPQLQGYLARKVYREMHDNDPVVGAMTFAIDMLMRQVEWRVDGNAQAAEFVESCLHDMSQSWTDFISSVMSMATFGYSYHELVFKRRQGRKHDKGYPGTPRDTGGAAGWAYVQADPNAASSKYDDGKIGWRKLPIRAQETQLRWELDREGGIHGFWQLAPPDYAVTFIPIQKALLFRTTTTKANPEGRALDPATPMFTPAGWKLLADLEVGSPVFDEQGKTRYVTAVADWDSRPVYRVTLADRTSVIADAEHLWEVSCVGQPAECRDRTQVLSTATLFDHMYNRPGRPTGRPRQGQTFRVHRPAIATAQPLEMPEQHLLVDPYVLGLWLGDGSSRSAHIACHVQDLDQLLQALASAGYPDTYVVQNGVAESLGRMVKIRGNLQGDLKTLGVLQASDAAGTAAGSAKHVPWQYLMGSAAQRRELLAGLVDSDGHVGKDGTCSFANTNFRLTDACAQLVRSLGGVARVTEKSRKDGLNIRQVTFVLDSLPTRHPRKQVRLALNTSRRYSAINTSLSVVSIEPLPERQATRCIEVDSPSHLFLAGESMVPTHNSILRSAYRPWFFKKRIEELEAIGVERNLAGLPVFWIPPEYLSPDATPDQMAIADSARSLVRNIRRDEQQGIVMPNAFDALGHKMFDLTVLEGGKGRPMDTDRIINRYNVNIAMVAIADVILMGHEQVGTQALAATKADLFTIALQTWLKMIADVFNSHALPYLLWLNGLKGEVELVPGVVGDVNLIELSQFVLNMSQAGMTFFPDDKLEDFLREAANIPEKTPGAIQGPVAARPTLAKPSGRAPAESLSVKAGPKNGDTARTPASSDNMDAEEVSARFRAERRAVRKAQGLAAATSPVRLSDLLEKRAEELRQAGN